MITIKYLLQRTIYYNILLVLYVVQHIEKWGDDNGLKSNLGGARLFVVEQVCGANSSAASRATSAAAVGGGRVGAVKLPFNNGFSNVNNLVIVEILYLSYWLRR